jgi:hypothetical protein
MSEYPIPHGEHYHSCILRRWRPAFLHAEGELQICHRANEQNALKIVSPPPLRGKQTSSPEKTHESMANEKGPLNPYPLPKPRVKTSIKTPALGLEI